MKKLINEMIKMRAFLAIDITNDLVERIEKVQRQIMESEAPIKLVEPENLHFTFKFFGDITEQQCQQIIDLTEEKLEDYQSFPLNIKGTGVFPHLGYIRVIWLGVEDGEQYSRMQKNLDEEWIKMGFKREKSYIPHLTIGRVKGAKNKEILTSIIQELKDVEIGSMEVDRIILKQSELTPAGPIYTDLKDFIF